MNDDRVIPDPDLDKTMMSRADLYRWANDPGSELSQEVVDSACSRILQQDEGHWDAELDNWVCDNWCVALRAVLGEAWETYLVAQHLIDNNPALGLFIAEAHGRQYVARMLIRRIVQNMFREDVPREERML